MFQYLHDLRQQNLQYLEFNAGKDPQRDSFTSGVLSGINEVLNMTVEDLKDD